MFNCGFKITYSCKAVPNESVVSHPNLFKIYYTEEGSSISLSTTANDLKITNVVELKILCFPKVLLVYSRIGTS